MLNYNHNNFCAAYDAFCDILEYLDIEEISDEELWSIYREFEWDDLPVLENIVQRSILDDIARWVQDNTEGHECTCFVNSFDTHLIIDNRGIYDLEDFIDVLNLERKAA